MLELYVNPNSLDQISDVTLDGIEYKYRLYYSKIYSRWYMDWFDSSYITLNSGTKITVGQPLLKSRMFKGTLLALSVSSDETPPQRRELGKRVKLIYLNKEEYPQQVLRRPIDEID
jgi:hypothetical protein